MGNEKTAEQFLREKLESEISSFGDGTTEFHTRDIEHLLKCLDDKDENFRVACCENVDKADEIQKLTELGLNYVNQINELKKKLDFPGVSQVERLFQSSDVFLLAKDITAAGEIFDFFKSFMGDAVRFAEWKEKKAYSGMNGYLLRKNDPQTPYSRGYTMGKLYEIFKEEDK